MTQRSCCSATKHALLRTGMPHRASRCQPMLQHAQTCPTIHSHSSSSVLVIFVKIALLSEIPESDPPFAPEFSHVGDFRECHLVNYLASPYAFSASKESHSVSCGRKYTRCAVRTDALFASLFWESHPPVCPFWLPVARARFA
jgi:hypothetical protein